MAGDDEVGGNIVAEDEFEAGAGVDAYLLIFAYN